MRTASLALALALGCTEPAPAIELRPEPAARPGQTEVSYPDPPSEPPEGWRVERATGSEVGALSALLLARNGVRPSVRAARRATSPEGAVALYALYDHSALDACVARLGDDPDAGAACRADLGTSPAGTSSAALLRCREHGLVRAVRAADGALALAEHVRLEPGCSPPRIHAFSVTQLDDDPAPELHLDLETRGPEWRWLVDGGGGSYASPDGEDRRRHVYAYRPDLTTQLHLPIYERVEHRDASYDAPNRASRRVLFGYARIDEHLAVYVEEAEYHVGPESGCALDDDLFPENVEEDDEAACPGRVWAFHLEYDPARDRWSDPPYGLRSRPTRAR